MSDTTPHLLLINSSIEDREQLSAALTPLGLKVTGVSSGLEAIDILQSVPVDLVVTDIETGEFDAWRLARIIRSGIYPSGASLPIIVVTRIWCERITEITARDFGVNQLLSFEERQRLPDLVRGCLATPDVGLSKPRVLVVEDHFDNAQLVKKILFQRFDIEVTTDGESGLAAWLENRHDLVLLDVMLPKISGTAVLKEIMEHHPKQPVVIMTAHGTMELARHLMLNGAVDFVTKPFRPEELRRVCDLALRREDYLVSHSQFVAGTEKIQSLKHLLSDVINSMPSMLIGVDTAGLVTLWNKGAASVSGVSEEQALGCPLKNVWPRFDNFAELELSLRDGIVRTMNNLPQMAGEEGYRDITIYPLHGTGLSGAVIRVDDVTERVLLEKRIIQSEKMASMGKLAAGLAHEINNPLAGIMQNVQVVKNRLTESLAANQKVADALGLDFSLLNEYVRQRDIISRLDAVMASGGIAAKLIENMLNFSQKDSSVMISNNPVHLLDRAVELAGSHFSLKGKFDFRQIRISREYESDMPEVTCNGGQIQQALLNLLMCSAGFMHKKQQALKEEPRGQEYHPLLTLRLRKGKDAVRLEIEDNGKGLNDDNLARIFDPFNSPVQFANGSSLGLSTSYYIICENHHGNIAVESAPAVGTKFIISLPI